MVGVWREGPVAAVRARCLGSVAGALLGAVLGEPQTWGLDAAFPAMFVALLAPHVRTPAGRTAAGVAAAVALGAVPVTASGISILLAVSALIPAVFVQRHRDPAGRGADAVGGDSEAAS